MLSISKRLTSFPLKHFASRTLGKPLMKARYLSTVPASSETAQLRETEFNTTELYQNTFSSPGKNIYDVRTGAYIPVQQTDLDLLPEGLAGEALEDFTFVSKPTWMIRDSTKLVCRMLDDFVERKESTTYTVPKGIARNVYFPELTDRPEWDKCKMFVSSHGEKLHEGYSQDPMALTVPTMGEGSFVEHVMDKLKSSGKDMPSKIILTGERGVGKSIVMNQAVLHARKNGWLVLFIPSGWEHAQGGVYIDPVTRNTSKPQLYDNVTMSVDALRGLWRAHADKLSQLPLRRADYFDKYKEEQAVFLDEYERAASMPGRQRMKFLELRAIIEGELNDAQEDANDVDVLARFDYRRFKPETLEDLLIFGVAFRQHAGEVFTDLIEELKQCEKFPVLIAVDQYNAWEVNSAFYYGERVHSKDLCVPRALRMLPDLHNVKDPAPVSFELKNGLCLMATSLKHVENKTVKLENAHQHAPLAIRIPAYNQVEFVGTMCHYVAHEVISSLHLGQLLAFRMLTASNPRLVRKDAVSHFFPTEAVEAMNELYQGTLPENEKDLEEADKRREMRKELMASGHYEDSDVDILMAERENMNENRRISHPSDRYLRKDYGNDYKETYKAGEMDAYHRRFAGNVDNARVGGMGPDPLGQDDYDAEAYEETFDADGTSDEEEEEEEQLGWRTKRAHHNKDDDVDGDEVEGEFDEPVVKPRGKVMARDGKNVDSLKRKIKDSRKK